MKIFVDCDILIDAGLGREPFCRASGELLDYPENNKYCGFIAWHSIANFFISPPEATINQKAKILLQSYVLFCSLFRFPIKIYCLP